MKYALAEFSELTRQEYKKDFHIRYLYCIIFLLDPTPRSEGKYLTGEMMTKAENRENIENKSIDRRKMLKTALAAGGAITAAAFLEGKWLKPVVKTGILPVHAQSTCPFVFFYPGTEDLNPDEDSGTGLLFAVGAMDHVSSTPPAGPGDLLDVSGPISFSILGYTGFTSLAPLTGQSGTMTNGLWTGSPIETFAYAGATDDATVTVRWVLNGCVYTFTYDIDWAPNPQPEP